MNWPPLPFTYLGMEVALNLITVGILAEAYLRPPRGFRGSPLFVLIGHFVLSLAVVLLSVNFTYWLMEQWRGNG